MAEELPTPGPRAPDRRRFLRTALWGSGLAGAGGLAGVAAHASERIAAPIACWLVGHTDLSPAAALAIAEEI